MLHAAAMLLGLAILWFLATLRFGGALELAGAACAVLACVALSARAGGLGAFARAPRLAWTFVLRAGSVLHGALATIRAAIAADVSLKPALIRIRTRSRGADRAVMAGLLSTTPGMVLVDSDPEGFLAHVMNEDSVDAGDLGALESAAGVRSDRGAE